MIKSNVNSFSAIDNFQQFFRPMPQSFMSCAAGELVTRLKRGASWLSLDLVC